MSEMQYQKSAIERLNQVYLLFENVTSDLSLACKEKCADCCTCNVTATSLEMAYLFDRVNDKEKQALETRLNVMVKGSRYRPAQTTNGFAHACMTGQKVHDENNDPSWGACPFLEEDLCTIYHVRPFGCRSMMSQQVCKNAGYANMPPLALTINTIFLQYIEHLDAGGISGNFFDLLAQLLDLDLALENPQDFDKTELFVRNREIPALMIPPEHRSQTASIVRSLGALMQQKGGQIA